MSDDVVSFIDASCPKCHRRFGWQGRVVDQPPCPRCGHQPDKVALERDQHQLNEARELFKELRQANPGWEKWQRARVAAGLTLRQAARLLEMTPTNLSAIEQCRSVPSEEQAKRMAECYGG